MSDILDNLFNQLAPPKEEVAEKPSKSLLERLWDSFDRPPSPTPVKPPVEAVKAPSGHSIDTIFPALLQAESKGVHLDEKGQLVKSKVGAEGISQLMPSTAKKPGYGIEPVKDKSEKEYLRVGKEYLQKMYDKFGDWEKALAAYNIGVGNVMKAEGKAERFGGDWKEHLNDAQKKETLPYIKKILSPQNMKPISAAKGILLAATDVKIPRVLEVSGEVAQAVGDKIVDVASNAGLGVNTSAALATAGEMLADPLNFIPGGKGVAAAGVIGQALKWGKSKETLKQAEALEMLGENAQNIFQRLGVYRGPVDNKWRSVISDEKASLKLENFKVNQYDDQLLGLPLKDAPLSSLLNHPDLFKQMPELKDIKVRAQFGGYKGGGYDESTNTIYLGSNTNRQEILETLMHEVQHAVQGRHNLTRGGNPRQFLADPKLFSDAVKSIDTKLDEVEKQIRTLYPDFNPYMTKQPEKVTESPLWERFQQYKMLKTKADDVSNETYQKYLHIGGEAEARAVALQVRDNFLKRFEGPHPKPSWGQVDPNTPKGSNFPLDFYDVDMKKLTKSPLNFIPGAKGAVTVGAIASKDFLKLFPDKLEKVGAESTVVSSFIPSKYIKTPFDPKTGYSSQLNNPIHLSDDAPPGLAGARLSGFTDANNKHFHGYDKNGEKFTIEASRLDPDWIVYSKDSNKTAEYFKNRLKGK